MRFGGKARIRPLLAGVMLAAALIAVAQHMANGQSSNNVYVANLNSSVVGQFAPNSNGNVAPAASITGQSTELFSPSAIAVDLVGNTYVANLATGPGGAGSVTIYPPAASGNASPSATISGAGTLLAEPLGIASIAAAISMWRIYRTS